MNDHIVQTLTKLFERHRIVFWYAAKQELREEFDGLDLPDVVKVEIANNEFGLKHRILREEPKQKFLLYHDGPQPDDLDNWLLDVLLGHGEFRTDQVGVWLSELELGFEFADVLQEHTEFFRAAKRKDALKKILKPDDTAKKIRLKMLAICAGSEARMDTVVQSLLRELSEKRDDKIKLIERSTLDSFFWKQMKVIYGYHTECPRIRDFALELFKSCYAMGTGGNAKLSGDALVFLKHWKDNRLHEESFKALSEEYAQILGIEHDLEKRDYRDVLDMDYFRVIDQKIISDLVKAVSARTISPIEAGEQIRQRRQGTWYGRYLHLYETIDVAVRFLQLLEHSKLEMESATAGVERYCQTWYQIDQLYREFTYHTRLSTQPTLMAHLTEQIENLYSNNFLLKLGDRFQEQVGYLDVWRIPSVYRQDEFFETWVHPFLHKDKKICVIISDALRYEIGEKLQRAIRQEDRHEAELSPMLSMLPSYTQLGMAALLPHKELAIADNENAAVTVDGQASSGTEYRTKILQTALKGCGQAVSAEDLLVMGKDETRELLKTNDVVYVYHNRIDAAGDKKESESKVFEAAHETVSELVRLIKKLTGNNVSNLIVTADHGFIYQNRDIDDSDFADVPIDGAQVLYKSRRFVLGHGLKANPGLHTFTAVQLGLAGNMEVQIPKSINRLRLKGSGSRYVHGGASLQEVIVPVLQINKKRQSDVSVVGVDILSRSSTIITSGQLVVTLYQREPVTDKMQSRILRTGIYTEEDELISDSHELLFDRSSENPRDREQQVRFMLTSKADKANGKEVILKLEEKLSDTSHYQEYSSRRYTMRRSFTSDFEF
jgi:uncharacterized protein (TIGR02687 family)